MIIVLPLHQILRCKFNGGTDSRQHAFIISNVFASDIKGSSVIHGCADNAAFQSNRDVHAFFNAHHLDWGMTLVVIAGYDDIEIAAARPEEECVRREWTNDVNALLPRTFNARSAAFSSSSPLPNKPFSPA